MTQATSNADDRFSRRGILAAVGAGAALLTASAGRAAAQDAGIGAGGRTGGSDDQGGGRKRRNRDDAQGGIGGGGITPAGQPAVGGVTQIQGANQPMPDAGNMTMPNTGVGAANPATIPAALLAVGAAGAAALALRSAAPAAADR